MPPDQSSNPLERTPDMEGLSAADRARIYKERAAAAGIGRVPNPQGDDGGEAAQPPAAPPPTRPAAPAPRPAAATGNGQPDGAGGAPARPAAAAARAGGAPTARQAAAGALTPEQRQRLAAAAQRGAAQGQAAAAVTPAKSPAAEQQQRLVYVWPHLVTIEFMASVLMLLSMVVVSIVLQAPLEGHANPDKTPNPSKAPWYFLNLQELLLHMHPALAGVLVPSGALALIAIIPYFDRDTRDVGKWFGTPKAVPIAWFTWWYSCLVLPLLIVFDEFVGVKPMMKGIAESTGVAFFNSGPMVDIVVPMIFMNVPILLLLVLVHAKFKPVSVREWMICLFTGFLAVYVVLTIFGTFFRGQGMHLYWPWDPRQIRIE
jgi:menaquinol-cytochrome c reductase cytochrome b/c subunit